MLELRLKKLYFLKKAFIIFHEMELFKKNTDDSDITMNRTRKRAWRNEQQVSTNTNEAIENLKTYFDSKFDDNQQQFSKEKEKLAKRMKADSKYKFRYKSNQMQFGFNESICDKVDTIVKLIKRGSQKSVEIGQIHQRGY